MPASKARGPATDVAKAAKPKDVKDFASTSTKNLPKKVKKVKKEQIERIREYVTKLVREVMSEGKYDGLRVTQGKGGDWWVNADNGYQDGPFRSHYQAQGHMKKYKRTGKPAPPGTRTIEEGITTKMWKDAGEPFEVWLRYSQASSSQKAQVEKLFGKKYPNIKEAAPLKRTGNRGIAVIHIGRDGTIQWQTTDGTHDTAQYVSKKNIRKAVDKIKKVLVKRYDIKIVDKHRMLNEWSIASPNTGAGQSEWEIWNGGKIRATAPNKEAATKLKNKMKLSEAIEPQRYTMKQDEESGDWHVWDGKTLHKSFDADDRRTASKTLWTLRKNEGLSEAYNRGTALITIGRDGVIYWRASDGSYDADLPGKRSKEHVQRRLAQLKKQLWGYTIKVNDVHGILKEAKWEIEWYDPKNGGKWHTRIVGSEHSADVEADKIFSRIRAGGDRNPSVSVARVGQK